MMNIIFSGESEIKYASLSTEKQDDMESYEDLDKESPRSEQVCMIRSCP